MLRLGVSRGKVVQLDKEIWDYYTYTLNLFQAAVAQLVEQLIRNQQVNGSSPFSGSR